MAKIYNLRNNKQNDKTQVTKPASLSLNANPIINTAVNLGVNLASKLTSSEPKPTQQTNKNGASTIASVSLASNPTFKAQYAAQQEQKQKAQLAAAQKQRTTNFEPSLEEDKWYYSIVDNSISSGTRVNDFGFLTSHCKDAQNGELILVNNKGEVQLIEQGEQSEDNLTKVAEVKAQYEAQREEYDAYMGLQKLAKSGESLVNTNYEDTHQVNTFIDAFINTWHDYTNNYTDMMAILNNQLEGHSVDYSRTTDTWKEYGAHTVSGRMLMNMYIKDKYGEDWKERFSGSTENIQELLALDEDEILKSYMAYQIEENEDGISFGHAAQGILTNVAEAGDLFATFTKPLLFTADNQRYQTLLDMGMSPKEADLFLQLNSKNTVLPQLPVVDKDHKYLGENYFEMVGAGFAPTWSETGRRVYDINSYSGLTNIVLEVLSDPEFLLSAGSKIAAGAAEAAVRSVITNTGDDAAKITSRVLNETLRNGVKEGLTNAEVASRIASRISTDNVEGLTKVITDALDYSHAYKLSRSLKVATDIVDETEQKLLLTTIGPAYYTIKAGIAGVQYIKNTDVAKQLHNTRLTEKAIKDAFAETVSQYDGKYGMHNVEEFLNTLDKNVLGLNIAEKEEVLRNLSKETRIKAVRDANVNMCNKLDKAISEFTGQQKLIDEELSVILSEASNGKYLTLQDYINDVTRIMKDNDLYDTNIASRLDKTKMLYNRAIIQRTQNNWADLMAMFRDTRNKYFEVIRTVEHVKPDLESYAKYADYTKDHAAPILTFEEFCKIAGYTDSIKTYDKYVPPVAPDKFMKYADFFAHLKAQPDYKPMYEKQIVAKYNKYRDALYAENKKAYKAYVKTKDAIKKHNANVRTKASAAYKKYKKAAQERLWQDYTAHNDAVNAHNQELRVASWEAYMSELNAKLRDITNEFTSYKDLFTDSETDQKTLARIEELLEKEILTKKEWREVYDSLNKTVHNRRVEAYMGMHVGTATLPYVEDVTKRSLSRLNFAEVALRNVQDKIPMRSVKEFGSMSEVKGKLYQLKLNQVDIAGTLLSDTQISRAYNDVIELGEFGQGVDTFLRDPNSKGKLAKAAKELVDDAYSAKRYQTIVHFIDSSTNIIDEIKPALKDKLFSLDGKTKHLFNDLISVLTDEFDVRLSKELAESRAKRVVRHWVDRAMSQLSQNRVDWSNRYLTKLCNESDTLSNVRNIEKQFNEVCELEDKYMPVFYSMNFLGESGGITEFSVRLTDGTEYTVKGMPRGDRIDQQRVFADISAIVDELQVKAGADGKNVKFIGFNNHAIGLDLDGKFSKQVYHAGASVKLYDTLDVAEQLRIKDGLPVVPEATYKELEDLLTTEFLQWYSDCLTTNQRLTLTLTPRIVKHSKMTAYLDMVGKYSDPTAYAITSHMRTLGAHIKAQQAKINAYHSVLADGGLLYAEHGENIMPLLTSIPGNKDMIISAKLIYDDNVISRYFDKAVADGNHASELFEFAQNCDHTLSRIMQYDILKLYKSEIDQAYAQLTKVNATRLYLDAHGIALKEGLSTAERYAVLHQVFHDMGLRNLDELNMVAGNADAAKLIYEAQTLVFGYGKDYNVFENLHGSVVRETSMLHSPNTILKDMEDVRSKLVKQTSYIEAQEQALRSAGLTGSLEYIVVKNKAEAAKKLTDYIARTKERIEQMNAAAYFAYSLASGDKHWALSARQEMLSTSDEYTKFMKAWYELSEQREPHRLEYLVSQTPDDILGHLIKDSNGRMFIDKESSNLNTVNALLEKVNGIPHVKYDETDSLVRIWFNAKELTQEELDALIEQYSTFSLKPMTDVLYTDHLKGMTPKAKEAFEEMAKDNAQMLVDLAEYGPANITYGMFTMNTRDLVFKLDNRYFKDIADEFLDYGILNALGNFKGQVACMYHGDISKLAREELFISNNQFTNICNMYGHVINTMDSVQDLIGTVFNKNNSFATAVESFKTMDHIVGHKEVAETLRKNGYVAVALTGHSNSKLSKWITGADLNTLKLHQLDVSDARVYKAAMESEYTTIMRYDTFRELQKQIDYKNLALGAGVQTNKVVEYWKKSLMFYHTQIRYPFIESYLFMKPSTWIRNIFDSTSKAMLKEGPEYLQYIPEAVKTYDAYTEIENTIYTTFKKTDTLSVKRYFDANPDCPMTMDMFVMLKSYFNNPLSGTQLEETLKAFSLDPTVIFKRYTNLDLAKEEYKTVIEIYKKFDDVNVPMHRRMSQINAELAKTYDRSTASILTQMYERYAGYASQMSDGSFLDKIPGLNKWLNFNMERFNDVETINRLAIFLKRMEAGDNMGQALLAIGETQFDYSKSDFMRAVETIAPFSTFKFYNYQFWLDSVWNYNVIEYLGDAAKLFLPEQEDNEDYWSDESMSYRALTSAYIDSLGNDKENSQEYNSLHDYNGADPMTALENGWLKIGDKLYLKTGNSAIDAMTIPYVLGNPSAFAEEAYSMLFAPIQSFFEIIENDKEYSIDKIIDQLKLSEDTANELKLTLNAMDKADMYTAKAVIAAAYIKDHAYELTSLFPLIGTVYYSLFSTYRNTEYALENGNLFNEGILSAVMPSLFAPVREDNTYNKYAESYYARPVGFDWYNQSDEYRATHRYVMGVSYVPAWVNKDPATYIDTWGRMQQLGIPKEALPELFENGKSWWFTKDDYGTYKLHNYQLMIKDEAAYNEIYNILLKYGWSAQEAEQLMAEVAIPTWKVKAYSNKDAASIKGYGSYRDANSAKVLNSVLINSKAALNTAKYNMGRYSGNGKWSQHDTMPKTYRVQVHQVKGHDPSRTSKKYQKAYRWHRRTRDIYRDNYAKYGASRMAMEQNLRAYSNRSITEMRRTNMNIRYARIHNRWWAS